MSLFEHVKQFLYTHPVQHHKTQLLLMIQEAEEKYLRRIAELEQDATIREFQRAVDASVPKSQIVDVENDHDEEDKRW